MGADSGKPVHFLLSHFELTSDDFVNGAPREVHAAFDHFSFDLADFAEGSFAPIAALGYDKLDLSSAFQARFDKRRISSRSIHSRSAASIWERCKCRVASIR